jgi:enoyl-CoA hydratase
VNYKHLLVEKEGQVDWVTMNRPETLNALNRQLVDELRDYFAKLYWDKETRIVVLRGAGTAFSAGLDLKEPREENTGGVPYGLRSQRRISEIVMLMRRCPQPIISLLKGPVCGGGFGFALASDVRIAGESMRANCAFIKIGLSGCDIGTSYFLPRLVGASVAAELLLTGRFIKADRALRTGLVSEVVPDDKLEDTARVLVDEMLATTPLGLRLTKECLNVSIDASSLEAQIAVEDRNQILCAQSADFREGIDAFLQKRKPKYSDA